MTSSYLLLVSLFTIAVTVSVYLFLKTNTLKKKLSEKDTASSASESEKENLAVEKKKLEEKNKKLFGMSEAVYKEKKRVDEENEKLIVQKSDLEKEKKKVDEKVKKLWSQSMAIHKEKERINELKTEIEIKHKEIIDSVNYAKRIQEAILPDRKEIMAHLPNSFLLFKPKDIVAGDFYWFGNLTPNPSPKERGASPPSGETGEGVVLIAAVDCTGHGVPGAFMSMIGNTLLNQIVFEKKITEPAKILTELNIEVNASLKQTQFESESRDGMDVGICSFEFPSPSERDGRVRMQFAGANRPLYFVRNGELTETKANKFPIGGLSYDVDKTFTNHVFQLQKGDAIYITSDGYADQFSPQDKKLMTKKFKEILVSIQDKSMEEQRDYLDTFIENWKGGMEQTDDVLVIGVRI
ncbi:MAG: hypothetical protein EPN85_03955 [Bacteroidetes bacterium]|nr:MAG: hypothetical protein EPN85_03955 [Bacteroidota bacterium]